jgi:hypothetical protein
VKILYPIHVIVAAVPVVGRLPRNPNRHLQNQYLPSAIYLMILIYIQNTRMETEKYIVKRIPNIVVDGSVRTLKIFERFPWINIIQDL